MSVESPPAVGAAPAAPRKAAVLRDANARWLVVGQLGSQICDRMALAGILWFLTTSAGAALVPWFIAVSGLPHLALAWWAGRIINTLGALKVVVWADLLRGALFLGAAALMHALPLSADIIVLFTLALAGNLGAALFNPAILALPVRLARRDAYQPNQLTALLSSCGAIGTIVGPALAALIYMAGSLETVLALTGIAYLVAGLVEQRVRLPDAGAPAACAPRTQSHVGQVVRRHPLVGWLFGLLLLVNLGMGPIVLFLPLYAAQVFTGGIDAQAFLQSSVGAGMIAGGLAAAAFGLPGSRLVRITVPVMLATACFLGFALSASLPLSCLLLVMMGASLAAGNAGLIGLFQTIPGEHEVPGVMAVVNLFGVASLPLSMAVIGVVLTFAPATTVAIACAATSLLFALMSPAIPGLREPSASRPISATD
jgi:MFS family permease